MKKSLHPDWTAVEAESSSREVSLQQEIVRLIKADGKMDQTKWRPICEENLLEEVEFFRLRWDFTVKHEKKPKHRVRAKSKCQNGLGKVQTLT